MDLILQILNPSMKTIKKLQEFENYSVITDSDI